MDSGNNDIVHITCICGKRHQSSPDIICMQCEKCDEWYYVKRSCVGLQQKESTDDFDFTCNNCPKFNASISSIDSNNKKVDEILKTEKVITRITCNDVYNDVVHVACTCGKRHQPSPDIMCIQCDKCDEWYHVKRSCVGLGQNESADDFIFICNNCHTSIDSNTKGSNCSNGNDKKGNEKSDTKLASSRKSCRDKIGSSLCNGSNKRKRKKGNDKRASTRTTFIDVDTDDDDVDLLYSPFGSKDKLSGSTTSPNTFQGSRKKIHTMKDGSISSSGSYGDSDTYKKTKAKLGINASKSKMDGNVTTSHNRAGIKKNKIKALSTKTSSTSKTFGCNFHNDDTFRFDSYESKDSGSTTSLHSSKESLKNSRISSALNPSKTDKNNKSKPDSEIKHNNEKEVTPNNFSAATVTITKIEYEKILSSLEETKLSLKSANSEITKNKNHYEKKVKLLQIENKKTLTKSMKLEKDHQIAISSINSTKNELEENVQLLERKVTQLVETNEKLRVCNDELTNWLQETQEKIQTLQTDNEKTLNDNKKSQEDHEKELSTITATKKEIEENLNADKHKSNQLEEANKNLSVRNKTLTKEVQDAHAKIDKLEETCDKLKKENCDSLSKIDKLEASNKKTKNDHWKLNKNYQIAQLKISELETENRMMKDKLEVKIEINRETTCEEVEDKKQSSNSNIISPASKAYPEILDENTDNEENRGSNKNHKAVVNRENKNINGTELPITKNENDDHESKMASNNIDYFSVNSHNNTPLLHHQTYCHHVLPPSHQNHLPFVTPHYYPRSFQQCHQSMAHSHPFSLATAPSPMSNAPQTQNLQERSGNNMDDFLAHFQIILTTQQNAIFNMLKKDDN